MKRRNFSQIIYRLNKRIPDLHLIDRQILCLEPVDHFIHGFFVEFTDRKSFLYHLIWPLFYREKEITLGFATKLKSTIINFEDLSTEEVEQKIHLQLMNNKSLLLESDHLLLEIFLKKRRETLQSIKQRGLSEIKFPQILIPYSYGCLLNDDMNEAEHLISAMIGVSTESCGIKKSHVDDLNVINKLLSDKEYSTVQEILLDWEKEMRQYWGI